jgi:hypothetical protein
MVVVDMAGERQALVDQEPMLVTELAELLASTVIPLSLAVL